ncbi:MAG TPA: hypothetical protein VN802_16890 [Stellaceae bacterium]|nr:hypothetical protein [Stellaceae bacterium]
MTAKTLLRLAALALALAAPLAACAPFGSGAPYDQSDKYKNSNGTSDMGSPGSAMRD